MSVHEALLELLRACGVDPDQAVTCKVTADSKELEVSAELYQYDESGKILHDGHEVLTRTVQRHYMRVGAEDWQLMEGETDG